MGLASSAREVATNGVRNTFAACALEAEMPMDRCGETLKPKSPPRPLCP
jgi:hypothetical protein